MSYQIEILPRAQKELAALPQQTYSRVRDAIRNLALSPRPAGCKKLVGREGWRIRIGSFRVIYEIDDKAQKLIVMHVGHRRDVYD
ncbi:type II toxin-antitoxin system RelE/ParE family toxin [candidate division KSB1 bacterium]|nr:type II toxin-antitoxin system RelE/ParE family toxin [candidate division KSB1 bacterium]